jgi:uncharacterized membrane protein
MDIAQTIGIWVHTLSTVVVLGFYGVFGRIVLPALTRSLDGPELGRAVAGIERKALPFLGISLVAFIVSGVYLLAIDEQFAGLGNYAASSWNTLMLVKHGLVAVLAAGGAVVHVLATGLADPDLPDDARRKDLSYLRLAAEVTTAVGAIILLLTAAAQVG